MQRLIHCAVAFISVAFIALSLLLIPRAALSADVVSPSPRGPRVVNVTPDSTPGWLPSEDLEHQARRTALDYMADMDSGKYAEAYAFLADIDKKGQSLSAFSDRLRQFNARAGAVVERRVVTITWTKNPAQAPLPGIYVALDLVSRFANIDRHCGFLVLYQSPSGDGFQVMREENNFLDNVTAANIAKQSSSEAVEKTWTGLSAHCPGYQLAANQTIQSASVTQPPPLPEAGAQTIGYPSVDAAMAALHSKASVVITNQSGWTVAEDTETQTIWSFPPAGHPAYPAAVKRQLVKKDGGVSLEMSVHCEASKQACDDLVRAFEQLNADMAAKVRGPR